MTKVETFAPAAINFRSDCLLLDFDGTLVEIADRPDLVEVPEDLGSLLQALSARMDGALALVSGRVMAEITEFIPEFSGPVVGSHGAECRGLPGLELSAGPRDLTSLHRAFSDFAAARGLLFEPKPHGAALHFRARPEAADEVRAFVEAQVAAMPGMALQPAKMAFEIKPEGASKDQAVAAIMALAPFAGRRPIFAGDDTTDEPALRWVSAHGGTGLKVGEGPSAASCRVKGPEAVLNWLRTSLKQHERGGKCRDRLWHAAAAENS